MMAKLLLTAGAAGAVYKLTGIAGVVLGKALEIAAEKAFFSQFEHRSKSDNNSDSKNISGDDVSVSSLGDAEYAEVIKKHSPQYILMEMDVEAKVSYARSLIKTIRTQKAEHHLATAQSMTGLVHIMHPSNNNINSTNKNKKDVSQEEPDFIEVCLVNLSKICDELIDNLHNKIYAKMDYHKTLFFSNWRGLDLREELLLLRSQCKVFDKRMKGLIQSLTVNNVLCGVTDVHGSHNSAAVIDVSDDEEFDGTKSTKRELGNGVTERKRVIVAEERVFEEPALLL